MMMVVGHPEEELQGGSVVIQMGEIDVSNTFSSFLFLVLGVCFSLFSAAIKGWWVWLLIYVVLWYLSSRGVFDLSSVD